MPYVREIQAVYRRVATERPYAGLAVCSPDVVVDLARELIGDASQERFVVLYLNTQNRLLCFATVGVGALGTCPVSPTEVFKNALLANAAALIASHNHPSGDPRPSREDDALTRRLVEAGTLVGIQVLDHVIVGAETHFSYAGSGRMGG